MTSFDCMFFLRHLTTINNDLQIITGQRDSEIIKNDYLKVNMFEFDKIFCSPSERCKRTIELLGENMLSPQSIIYDERLLERNMGSLEGVKKAEAAIKYSDLFMGESFNVFCTPPNGESYDKFLRRVKDFYYESLSEYKRKKILICSHNQTLKLLRLIILGQEISGQSWSEYTFRQGEITRIC